MHAVYMASSSWRQSFTLTLLAVLLQLLGEGENDVAVAKHAHLDGVNLDITPQRSELAGEKVDGWYVDLRDAAGVLSSEGGEDRHAIAAQRGDCLEVRLDPRPTRRVRPCNAQHLRG